MITKEHTTTPNDCLDQTRSKINNEEEATERCLYQENAEEE